MLTQKLVMAIAGVTTMERDMEVAVHITTAITGKKVIRGVRDITLSTATIRGIKAITIEPTKRAIMEARVVLPRDTNQEVHSCCNFKMC